MPALRGTRTQLVVRARGPERSHAIPLHVHVRACDLAHFHAQEREGLDVLEALVGQLDRDPAFQDLVRAMDDLRGLDELIKARGRVITHLEAATMAKLQWFVEEQPHHLVNVLERSRRPRGECFARRQPPTAAKTTKETHGTGDEDHEDYRGGLYRPLPMRRLAVTVWMYPPHVELPATGDRIPVDATADDFFLDDAGT